MDLLVLMGSLRSGSLTRAATELATAHVGDDVRVTISGLPAQLPHYDQDLDTRERLPQVVSDFRAQVEATDAVLVVTPEYNGSLPGVLKNAIDWASRPRGAAPLDGLPAGVISVSPSRRGGQWAREDAVKVLTVAGARVDERAAGVASASHVLADVEADDARETVARVRAVVDALVADTLVAA